MTPSTAPPSPSPSSTKREPDVLQAFHTFLRNAANHPSPIPPGITGKYWLHLAPLVLHGVSPTTYQRAKIHQSLTGGCLAAFARASKLDYVAHTETVVVSLANRESHVAGAFVSDVRGMLLKWGVYWPRVRSDDDIVALARGSVIALDYAAAVSMFEADAALAWRDMRYPFLVCEVANSGNCQYVLEKKRPYLLGSRGVVRFFVVVMLEREDTRPRGRLLADGALESVKAAGIPRAEEGSEVCEGPVGVQQDGRSLDLQDELDWVPGQPTGKIIKARISVYKSKMTPSDTGTPTRTIETVVESLEVWPTRPTEALTFCCDDLGAKNISDAFRTMRMRVPYSTLNEHIAALVAEEDNAHGADNVQSEVDAENVEIESE